MQALAKDLPWKLKDSRVLEILQAVSMICAVLSRKNIFSINNGRGISLQLVQDAILILNGLDICTLFSFSLFFLLLFVLDMRIEGFMGLGHNDDDLFSS